MTKFRVSQGELWTRMYLIEAETIEIAKAIYKAYQDNVDEDHILHMYDPEYVDDIKDDVVWYSEDGSIIPIEEI